MSIAVTIGGTIGLIGLVLLLYGLFGTADYSRSDGINSNLWWGLLMLVFGVLMAGINYLTTRRRLHS
jgi:drug/metabolite transporter (DMT)-like permease